MRRFVKTALYVTLPCLALTLGGCDNPFSKDRSEDLSVATVLPSTNDQLDSTAPVGGISSEVNRLDLDESNSALAAVFGASEIPYPVYPNGQKYRVGGENGLKIVVFQTDDEFETVDRYYSQFKENAGMARHMAMQDYVRYSNASTDSDPWATHKPGIVIHQFNDQGERKAVGASPSARTNIIMSF